MSCDMDVKHEEDLLPRTEIKTEPQVNDKFYIFCFMLSLYKTSDWFIEILSNCVDLQDIHSEIKIKVEEFEDIHVKHDRSLEEVNFFFFYVTLCIYSGL